MNLISHKKCPHVKFYHMHWPGCPSIVFETFKKKKKSGDTRDKFIAFHFRCKQRWSRLHMTSLRNTRNIVKNTNKDAIQTTMPPQRTDTVTEETARVGESPEVWWACAESEKV